ncbi:hypothetical protein [Marinomonas sp. GJ51-6]|uniref:hypothetical protein n=1 Tax=Marinomonas sp. GJ51-6 TaxID=2992802 RepID=UPI002934AE35|nr:hypothetical protein [Marinomonas sp. GJ51-6]WOD08826.1 hypothetical protein ONZ50_07145 [Marinomonas sp. GJ51-6]
MSQLASALMTMLFGILGCAVYFYGSNILLDKVFPTKKRPAHIIARNLRVANTIRPWLFLVSAVLLLTFYLFYPVVDSIRLSFFDRTGDEFVEPFKLRVVVW